MARAGLDRMTVVHAAAELADTAGLDGVTLAAVAEQLGVRTPSLYNHIGGLPGLRRELALLGLRELSSRFIRAAVGKSGNDAIRAIATSYRQFALERPGLYEATLRAPDPEEREVKEAAEEVVNVLLSVFESFGFQGEDALHAVRGLRSIAHGFVSLELSGGFGLDLDRNESYNRLVTTFLRGLESP